MDESSTLMRKIGGQVRILDKTKTWFDTAKEFLTTGAWRIDSAKIPLPFKPLLLLYRCTYLAFDEFTQKKTLMTASALSYATVLGIIPFLVVLVALSKGFLQTRIETDAPKAIDAMIMNAAPVFGFLSEDGAGAQISNSLKEYVNTQLLPTIVKIDMNQIGVYGALTLIVIAFSLMRTIERSFNDIWGVEDKRSFWSLFMRYWLAIALFPAAMLALLWVNGFGVFKHLVGLKESIGVFRMFWDQLGSCLGVWIVFTLVYKFVPHTKVRLGSAIIGGVVGGSLWQLNNLLGFMYVSKAMNVHYLYGSIGIVPIFLLGMYTGWLILLFGAHVSFASQNFEQLRTRMLGCEPTPALMQTAAVACAAMIARRFDEGAGAVSLEELSQATRLPGSFLARALEPLVRARLLVSWGEDGRYVLGSPAEKTRLGDILNLVISGDTVMDPRSWEPSGVAKASALCAATRKSLPEPANPSLAEIAKNLTRP